MSDSSIRTESGLIVPASAIEKKQRVLPAEKLKKIRRFFGEMEEEGLLMMLACRECHKPIEAQIVDRLLNAEGGEFGGRPVFICQCSERVVR